MGPLYYFSFYSRVSPPNDAATTPQNGVTDSPSTHGVTDSPSTLLARSPGKGPGPPQALPPQQSIVCVGPPPRRGRPVSRRAPRRSTSTRSVGKHILEVRARSNKTSHPFDCPRPPRPARSEGGPPLQHRGMGATSSPSTALRCGTAQQPDARIHRRGAHMRPPRSKSGIVFPLPGLSQGCFGAPHKNTTSSHHKNQHRAQLLSTVPCEFAW